MLMKEKINDRKKKLRGMRFLPFSMVLFLFCGCSGKPQMVFETDQETIVMNESQTSEGDISFTDKTYCVYVCGAVNSPGVYELATDSRIVDAVEAAGGFTKEASQVAVNLAACIQDEQQIYIPTLEEEKDYFLESKAQEEGLVNINTADSKQLQSLPGIGESRADAIINYREQNGLFVTIEDIMKVNGIKTSLFEQIKSYITV